MEAVTFQPIGIVHTPFRTPTGTPINPKGGCGVKGEVEIFPEYAAGLQDIGGFSHLFLIFVLHKVTERKLVGLPFLDNTPHGVFAMRTPTRPNPIGLSLVKLVGVNDNRLAIEDLDIVDGSPLLDIKPYVPDFDSATNCRLGWLTNNVSRAPQTRDDGRYSH